MGTKFPMNLWREGKLSHCACITDLLLCRGPASLRLVEIIQGFQAKALADWIERESMQLVEQVFASHARFRRHATVTAYLEQVSEARRYGKEDRSW